MENIWKHRVQKWASNLFALWRQLPNSKVPEAIKCSTPNKARNFVVTFSLIDKDKIFKTSKAHKVFFIFNGINNITSIDVKTKTSLKSPGVKRLGVKRPGSVSTPSHSLAMWPSTESDLTGSQFPSL